MKLNRSPFAWFVLVLAVLGVFAAIGELRDAAREVGLIE